MNRAALPHLRRQGKGPGGLGYRRRAARGGTRLPTSHPYFAAKAAMDSLAVSYAGELSRWGIETSIIVPGAFTKGTNHFAHSGSPADTAARRRTQRRPLQGACRSRRCSGLAALEPAARRCGRGCRGHRRRRRHAVWEPAIPRPYRSVRGRRGPDRQDGVGDRVRAELFRPGSRLEDVSAAAGRRGLDSRLTPPRAWTVAAETWEPSRHRKRVMREVARIFPYTGGSAVISALARGANGNPHAAVFANLQAPAGPLATGDAAGSMFESSSDRGPSKVSPAFRAAIRLGAQASLSSRVGQQLSPASRRRRAPCC